MRWSSRRDRLLFPYGLLSPDIAFDHRAVVRRYEAIEGREPLVVFAAVPVLLEFTQHGIGARRDDAGLRQARHGNARSKLARVAGRIVHGIDVEALRLRVERRKGDADAGPDAGNDQGLPAGRADALLEEHVVPRVDLALARHEDG